MKALLKKEKIFVSKAFSASIWASEKVGHASVANSTQVIFWSDQTSGTPIEDVQAAKTAVLLKTGFEPNVLTLGKQVWDALVNHPDILDRIKYSSNNSTPAIVSRQAMAALFEVEEIKVMKAIENTTAEPTAIGSDTNAFIGGKHALLSYRPSRAGMLNPSAGYTFAWTGLMGGAFGSQISSFPMVNLKSERIEIDL